MRIPLESGDAVLQSRRTASPQLASALCVAAGIVFACVAVERSLRSLAIAPPPIPVVLLLSVVGQAAGALVAAMGLFFRRRFALVGILLFLVAVIVQMSADVLLYGVRSVLAAFAWTAAAAAISALGWLALDGRMPSSRRAAEPID